SSFVKGLKMSLWELQFCYQQRSFQGNLSCPKNLLTHMSSKKRLPFTLGFIATMVGTIYVSKMLHIY
ncbi:hypothetical protein MKW98_000772, partial [Papaver atlanticum]